jgi:hypothetical protein
MSRVLLTLTCGVADAEAIATALRDSLKAPVHQRAETVLGRDFDDAGTVERVAGALARVAIVLELPADQVPQALRIATDARRRLPFRWHTVAVLDGGRVA